MGKWEYSHFGNIPKLGLFPGRIIAWEETLNGNFGNIPGFKPGNFGNNHSLCVSVVKFNANKIIIKLNIQFNGFRS